MQPAAGLVRMLLATLMLAQLPQPARADLVIYHFDVGQGDSTLLVDTETGKSLLVDAGNRGYGKHVLAPALRKLGRTEIDYFVATHYDADHIGGFDELTAEKIRLTTAAYDRGDYTDRKRKTEKGNVTQYGEYLKSAEDIGRKTLTPDTADPFDLGETSIEVIASGGHYLDHGKGCKSSKQAIKNSKDNDLSIALLVRHGEFSYFIGGDLTGGGRRTTPMEKLIAKCVGNIDVLKINHHGSETSSAKKFLTSLAPEVAIISVGNGGPNLVYRLPRQTILDDIAQLQPRPFVFLTNRGEGGTYERSCIEDRNIVIHTDGRGYTVNGAVMSVDENDHLPETGDSTTNSHTFNGCK